MTTQEAKDFLRSEGYFVDNLWHVTDVQNKFNCTDEEAQDILYNIHVNDGIVENIFNGIDILGKFNLYKEKEL